MQTPQSASSICRGERLAPSPVRPTLSIDGRDWDGLMGDWGIGMMTGYSKSVLRNHALIHGRKCGAARDILNLMLRVANLANTK